MKKLYGVLFSLLLHFAIIFLIFFILPSLFSKKNKNIDIAIDIISSEQLEEIYNKNKATKKVGNNNKELSNNKISDNVKKNTLKNAAKKKKKQAKKKKAIKKGVKKKLVKKSKTLRGASGDSKKTGTGAGGRTSPGEISDKDFGTVLSEFQKLKNLEQEKIDRENFIYGNNLTPSEKNNVKRQINNCWRNISQKLFNIDEIKDIKIKILVTLKEDGSVIHARFADSVVKRYMSLEDSLFRSVADSAIATFYRCDKIYNLPYGKYEAWKEFEFIFSPLDIYNDVNR